MERNASYFFLGRVEEEALFSRSEILLSAGQNEQSRAMSVLAELTRRVPAHLVSMRARKEAVIGERGPVRVPVRR